MLTLRSLPKQPGWLRRFFREPAPTSPGEPMLGVNDVWPESNNTAGAQKVWGAKFAARHPNVAVLDLSSFKCGHDAPIYGVIDNVINAARRPYSALHDIDANRPAGSIKIRVKAYAYTLHLHQERLSDWAERMQAFERRLKRKRSRRIPFRRRGCPRTFLGGRESAYPWEFPSRSRCGPRKRRTP